MFHRRGLLRDETPRSGVRTGRSGIVKGFRTPAFVHPLAPAPGRHLKTLNETRALRRGRREGELRTLRAIRLRPRDQQDSTHIPTGLSASSTDAFARKS